MSKKYKKQADNHFDANGVTKDILKMMEIISKQESISGIFSSIFNHPQEKRDENDLGKGMRLVPDSSIEDNRSQYSYLYKDCVKVSDMLFRRGGMCSGYKKGDYCDLISYPNYPKETLGNHVIVDLNGKIVLKAESCLDYPYYHKGVIASMKDKYYNLLTGKTIAEGHQSFQSENFLFVDVYSYTNAFKKGVYKITYATGEVEIFN